MDKATCFLKNIFYFIIKGYWGLGHDYIKHQDINKIKCKNCNRVWEVNTYILYNQESIQCVSCRKIIHKNNVYEIIDHKCK